jgi:hypothetical protein
VTGVRLVGGRASHERALLLAACVTVLFSTTVLAALAGYTGSVVQEGLKRALAHPSFQLAGVRIVGHADPGKFAATDGRVRSTLHGAFRQMPVTISESARSDSYVVPGQERRGHPDLTAFAMFAGIEGHAALVAGSWPGPESGGVVQAAIPAAAARPLGVTVGGTYTLHGRIEQGSTIKVHVTGLFRVQRADDYLWSGDRLVTDGTESGDYTTYGPFVVPPGTFTARFGGFGFGTTWTALPDTAKVGASELRGLATRLDHAETALRADGGFAVVSGLPALMTRLDQAVLVARSTMLIPLLQLVALAAYALLLVARLITDHRRMELALLRARGASVRQLAAISAAEGLLIAVPAAVAAPPLAAVLLRLASYAPVLKAAGVRLDQVPAAVVWTAGPAAALAAALVLTLPALRGITATFVQTRTARGRGARLGVLQRAGADLAFLVVAALALWQLAHYGAPITAGGVDPLLVAGPTLALLSGGTLLLRLVPVVSALGERATARGTGLPAALGLRQISRRPLRYTGPALLLVMAVAVGVLSLVTGSTWRSSQVAQADFQSGADLRIETPTGPDAPAVTGLADRYAALPGVTALSPVARRQADIGGDDVTLLAGDGTVMGGLIRGARVRTSGLATERPAIQGIPLPGRPDRIALDVRVTAGPGANRAVVDTFDLSVTITDARGLARSVDLGRQPADGATHTRTIGLADLTGPGGVLSYPIMIQSFVYAHTDDPGSGPLTLQVRHISGVTALPPGAGWQSAGPNTLPITTTSAGSLLTVDFGQPVLDGSTPGGPLRLLVGTPGAAPSATVTPLQAVVTAALARRAHAGLGGQISLELDGVQQPITITAIVPALPGTPTDQPAVLVDLGTLSARTLNSGTTPVPPDEWWLDVRDGDTAPAARVLDAHPDWHGDVTDRMALREELRDAPLGAALQGALVLGFGAALALALAGFAVSLSVTARERRAELAVLRVLGMADRQILGLVGIEQVLVVGLGLVCGTVLGLVVAALVVPRAVLTAQAAAPYPPISIAVPWPPIVLLLAGVAVPLAAVLLRAVSGQRRSLRRIAARIGAES